MAGRQPLTRGEWYQSASEADSGGMESFSDALYAISRDVVTFRGCGAAGKGNDSGAWARFIASVKRGRLGVISAGTYSISGAEKITLDGDLRLKADGPVVLTGSGTQDLFDVEAQTSRIVRIEGIEFQNFDRIVVGLDDVATTSTAQLDLLDIRDCTFTTVLRPFHFAQGGVINKLMYADNIQDGGYCGLYARCVVKYAKVHGNLIENILAPSSPSTSVHARAIVLGWNTTVPADQLLQGRYHVHDNEIDGVEDERSGLEAQGIRCMGYHVHINHNTVKNVTNADLSDCEGIYGKLVYGEVSGNTLENAGHEEGAIVVKGVARAGGPSFATPPGHAVEVIKNIITDNRADRAPGIGIFIQDVIVANNILDGCHGESSPKWHAIYTDLAKLDNVQIVGNHLYNIGGRAGIGIRNWGTGLLVERNTINGMDGSQLGSDGDLYGIQIHAQGVGGHTETVGLLDNPIIRDNKIVGMEKMATTNAYCISILRGNGNADANRTEIDDLIIEGNSFGTDDEGIDVGTNIQDFARVRVANNDFTNVTGTKVTFSTTPTRLSIRDNAGWMEFSDNPGAQALTTGTQASFTVTATGVAVGDRVLWWPPADLDEIQVTVGISAADTIEVAMNNPHGTTRTIAAGTWNFQVERY